MKESGDPRQEQLAERYEKLGSAVALNYNTIARDQGSRTPGSTLGELQLPSSGRADVFYAKRSAFNRPSLDGVTDPLAKRYLDEGLAGEPSLGEDPRDRRAELAARGNADELFGELLRGEVKVEDIEELSARREVAKRVGEGGSVARRGILFEDEDGNLGMIDVYRAGDRYVDANGHHYGDLEDFRNNNEIFGEDTRISTPGDWGATGGPIDMTSTNGRHISGWDKSKGYVLGGAMVVGGALTWWTGVGTGVAMSGGAILAGGAGGAGVVLLAGGTVYTTIDAKKTLDNREAHGQSTSLSDPTVRNAYLTFGGNALAAVTFGLGAGATRLATLSSRAFTAGNQARAATLARSSLHASDAARWANRAALGTFGATAVDHTVAFVKSDTKGAREIGDLALTWGMLAAPIAMSKVRPPSSSPAGKRLANGEMRKNYVPPDALVALRDGTEPPAAWIARVDPAGAAAPASRVTEPLSGIEGPRPPRVPSDGTSRPSTSPTRSPGERGQTTRPGTGRNASGQRSTTTGLRDQARNLRNQVRDLRNQARDLRNQARGRQNQARGLRGQARTLQNQVRDLRAQVRDQQGRARGLQSQARVLRGQARTLQNQARGLDRRARELQSRARGQQGQVREAQAQVRDLQARARALQEQARELQSRARGQQGQAREMQAQARTLQNRARDLQNLARGQNGQGTGAVPGTGTTTGWGGGTSGRGTSPDRTGVTGIGRPPAPSGDRAPASAGDSRIPAGDPPKPGRERPTGPAAPPRQQPNRTNDEVVAERSTGTGGDKPPPGTLDRSPADGPVPTRDGPGTDPTAASGSTPGTPRNRGPPPAGTDPTTARTPGEAGAPRAPERATDGGADAPTNAQDGTNGNGGRAGQEPAGRQQHNRDGGRNDELGCVSQCAEPGDDCLQDGAAAEGQGELVVTGGQPAPLLDVAEPALDDVAVSVVDRIECGRSAAA
ncbi:hypothetical protein AFB00_05445 [Pseudonocardia sp. HH130630-07]|nr:hypothetical protein AFB00_05445 [Pseudonocardia sp. HH130630-07]